MSKKLNGAELLQLILDGKVKFGDKFKRIDRDAIYVYKESKCLYDENQIEVGSSRLLAGTFELFEEKSVSFDDVLNNPYKLVRLDVSDIAFCSDTEIKQLNEYNSLDDKLIEIGEIFFAESIPQIIKNGKWYLKDD